MTKAGLRVLAARCHTSSCCPAIMESGEEIVIVGDPKSLIIAGTDIQERVGMAEAAVVIPKSLLLEAFQALSQSNIG